MNFTGLIDRWERYWRVMEKQGSSISMNNLNFSGSSVFELGCGPLFGWGPMAIYSGAAKYYYHDPALQRGVVESRQIRDDYFRPFYLELASNFGADLDFKMFYEKVMSKCIPLNLNKELPESTIDIMLSNSVLEHIPKEEINILFEKLYKILKVNGYAFHSVDFSSHGNGSEMMYKRETGLNSINLLRKSDIENSLIASGFKPEHIVYRRTDVEMENILPYWKKYSKDDLSSMVVFFLAKK